MFIPKDGYVIMNRLVHYESNNEVGAGVGDSGRPIFILL